MNSIENFCKQCGIKLNGQANCPNCLKPTGAEVTSDAPVTTGYVANPNKKRWNGRLLGRLFLLLYIGIPIVLGVVNCHEQHEWHKQQDAVERIEQASDDYLQEHRWNPLCASELGKRLHYRVENAASTLGDFSKRMDEAGQILLEAARSHLVADRDWLMKRYGTRGKECILGNLYYWQQRVLDDPSKSDRYWEDAEFRLRVETALGGATFNLKFE